MRIFGKTVSLCVAMAALGFATSLSPDAAAFQPKESDKVLPSDMTHESITRAAVKMAWSNFFNLTQPTNSMTKAADDVVKNDAYVDLRWVLSARHHCDSESFADAQSTVLAYYQAVVAALQKDKPDIKTARENLGYACHTIQDFYSHSNWVEQFGGVNAQMGVLGQTITGVVGPKAATCINCEGTDYTFTCDDNGCFAGLPQSC